MSDIGTTGHEAVAKNRQPNRYARILGHIFSMRYRDGNEAVEFDREEFVSTASELGIDLPKNLGDILYSFRYRIPLPEFIREKAPAGYMWVIRPAGRGRYRMALVKEVKIVPAPLLAETKIPDATPGVITMYALSDEQALLAKVRYNRLIDIFTGVTSYSLQNHLRTTVKGLGQVETDEIYIGIDRRGVQHVFPVQAKGGTDKLSIVQIEQDIALCKEKFPNLACLAIGAQFVRNDLIALFGFQETSDGIGLVLERHYRLVSPDEITVADLRLYQQQPLG